MFEQGRRVATASRVPDARFGSKEFAELERYLVRREMPASALDMSTLEGYLTGLAAGPTRPATGRWLPRVWGRCRNTVEALPFASTAELRDFRLLALAFLSQVRWHVEQPSPIYTPLFHRFSNHLRGADPWCCGFRLAMRLERTAWRPLQRTHPELLRFVELHGTPRGLAGVARARDAEPRTLAELAADAMPRIVRFWQSWRPRSLAGGEEVRQENARLSYVLRGPEPPD